MNKPVCTPPQLNFWIICALFMIVAVSPQLDLAVSAFFFRDNRFYLADGHFQPMRLGLLFHVRTHGRHLLEPGSGTAASAPVPQMGNKRGYYPRNSHRNCPHSPRLTFCL